MLRWDEGTPSRRRGSVGPVMLAVAVAFAGGLWIGSLHADPKWPTIGSSPVMVSCEEDEVIGYRQDRPGPQDLECIPYDDTAGLGLDG